tara:strand:- start:201 stop:536 length:336 start_codon:yes stop_codon:yes gene_type:complete
VIEEGKLVPKAIISVDFFVLPANYIELEALAEKYSLRLIEDAAQGFGGSINGKKRVALAILPQQAFSLRNLWVVMVMVSLFLQMTINWLNWLGCTVFMAKGKISMIMSEWV